MKKTRNKLLSWLLVLAMLMTMLPTVVLASSSDVYIGGVNLGDGSEVTYYVNGAATAVTQEPEVWNAKLETVGGVAKLTVRNLFVAASGKDGIKSYLPLNLVLEGASSITGGDEDSSWAAYGINVYGDLTISGNGSLSVIGGASAEDDSYGIYADVQIEINGGTVSAVGGTASGSSYGIYAKQILIQNGTVNATGGTAAANSYGISAGYGVTITGGTVNATGGEGGSAAYKRSCGIGNRVVISGGIVNATGGAAYRSCGIYYCSQISGGTVVATGGNAINRSWGIDRGTAGPELTGGVIVLRGGSSAPTTFTVKFETNGGSEIDSVKVTKNKTLDEPTVPAKDGYTFDGWYTDKELTKAYDFETKVTKGFTLYAKWTEIEKEPEDADTHNCPSEAFTDLDTAAWYHLDTDYAIENGIFKGVTETTFAPNDKLTRAMLVTVLYRVEGEPATNRSIPFADIDMGAYYANAVVWAQQNGIVKGVSETEFAPDNNITREQIAAIMHRYAQYKGYDVSVGENTNILSYDDFDDISEYAIPSMQWACGSGLMKGKTATTLNPLDNATRAEIAAILHRFLEANK